MTEDISDDKVIRILRERAKELNCLYLVEEVLQDGRLGVPEILAKVVKVVPSGWYAPEHCHAAIAYGGDSFKSPSYKHCVQELTQDIMSGSQTVGLLSVGYSAELPIQDEGPFLREERKLIKTFADRIGQMLLYRRLEPLFGHESGTVEVKSGLRQGRDNWQAVLEMLRVTDLELYVKVARKMLNYLCYLGIEPARELLEGINLQVHLAPKEHEGVNRPMRRSGLGSLAKRAPEVFNIAQEHFSDDLLHGHCQKWIIDHRIEYLLDILEDSGTHLAEVVQALSRFTSNGVREEDLSDSTRRAVQVSLVRRFLSRRLEFIKLTKDLFGLDDFNELAQRLIFPLRSTGHIGGKGAGLFTAMSVVRSMADQHPELSTIKCPKTWYVTSDAVMDFVHHNHLEELLEHKYRDIGQIRLEYANLVVLFKNCSFSSHMVRGLSLALDDFGVCPLVVRSSSLLEDGSGAAFSGKYKSLFIANQGTKQERLEALLDAIAEIYASMYGPDPIQYRKERGLLDFPEEMGLLIQQVVGTRVGKYLFPSFAGVGFSLNEFRWSPRIRREDGLLRLVPGLGTRAVDRVGDDYPVLVAPGQPRLRVNASIDEVVRYSPRYVDVINIEANSIETVRLQDLLESCGTRIPRVKQLYSKLVDGFLQRAGTLDDPKVVHFIPTFEGLLDDSKFVTRMQKLMEVLERHYGVPVDIEFAADETHFYLLQCRPQSSRIGLDSVYIPSSIPREELLFETTRHVSTAHSQDISHVVFVSPAAYDSLSDLESLRLVGSTIGRLNDLLPKRQFILIGPGRWGSRGDIKLGVDVTYADISNTAALIEVAYKRGNYQPDLSFGTHFFQDLVESAIVYLPLYPDDSGQFLNLKLLEDAENLLCELLPDAQVLENVVQVVDIRRSRPGCSIEILADGDQERAVARLVSAEQQAVSAHRNAAVESEQELTGDPDAHWLWRQRMVERLALELDGERFGVLAMYLFGSTKNATAGPGSDIDLLVHFQGSDSQLRELRTWFDGWSKALDEFNYQRSGSRTGGLLDVHIIGDEDIRNKSSYAVKIGAVSDAARPVSLKSIAKPLKK